MLPGHDSHNFVDERIFGRSYPLLHKAIDYAVHFYGRGHRRFFHTPQEARGIAMFWYPGDFDAVKSALLHIQIDWTCSRDPKFEKWLESQVEQRKREKKRNKDFIYIIYSILQMSTKLNLMIFKNMMETQKQQHQLMMDLINEQIKKPKTKKQKRRKKQNSFHISTNLSCFLNRWLIVLEKIMGVLGFALAVIIAQSIQAVYLIITRK